MNTNTLQKNHKHVYKKLFSTHKIVISFPFYIPRCTHLQKNKPGTHFYSALPIRIYFGIKKSHNKKLGQTIMYDDNNQKRSKKSCERILWTNISKLITPHIPPQTQINIISELPIKYIPLTIETLILGISTISQFYLKQLQKKDFSNHSLKNWNKKTNTIQHISNQIQQLSIPNFDYNLCSIFLNSKAHPTLSIKHNNKLHNYNRHQIQNTNWNNIRRQIYINQHTKKSNLNTFLSPQEIDNQEQRKTTFQKLLPIQNTLRTNNQKLQTIGQKEELTNHYLSHQAILVYHSLFSPSTFQSQTNISNILNIPNGPQIHFKPPTTNNYISTHIQAQNTGFQINQDINSNTFSSLLSPKSLFLRNYDHSFQIGDYDTLIQDNNNDIILDLIYNRVFILWKRVNSKEIHSQSMTVEILAYLLQHIDTNITNTELTKSSYSKNKNNMNGKIIIPLKKLIKQKIWKNILLSCSWQLHQFSLQLKKSQIKFGILQHIKI